MDEKEAVILVVGNETEYKARVADALAEARGASEVESTRAGVRIFSRNLSHAAMVVDTVPLLNYDDDPSSLSSSYMQAISPISEVARRWVSRNLLKRMSGELVFVVCVIVTSDSNDKNYQERKASDVQYRYSWLQLLHRIFEKYTRAMMILVNSEDIHIDEATKNQIRNVLERDHFSTNNINFSNLRGSDLAHVVQSAIAHSTVGVRKDKAGTMMPFSVEKVSSNATDADKFGPWGPERMILFGRTGSGKSTLAQMLTSGKLDPCSKTFASSSGIRGETKVVKRGQGRGWYVVDTPGFGEPENELSTISTDEVRKKLVRYVQQIGGVYGHFIYVVMKDRIDELEVRLWKLFVLFFGQDSYSQDIKSHFTVIVSNADQEWVNKNIDHLKKSFQGCESFLSADFPPLKVDDEEWETESCEVRMESLKELEHALAGLARADVICNDGYVSKMTMRYAMAHLSSEARAGNLLQRLIKVPVLKTRGTGIGRLARLTLRLAKALIEDEKFVLLPP